MATYSNGNEDMESDQLNGKEVLITGGLGFIGSNLAFTCLALGAKVTIYDCLDPKSGGNMFNVHDIEKDINIELDDVRNFESLSKQVRGKDIIFNCAAYTSHTNAMKEPLIDIDVNCKGVINLLEAIRRFNSTTQLIHIGTTTQIGEMIYNPVDEVHPEFPVDIYSANKSVSEKYVLIYASAYNLKASVVRLANVYGPRSNIMSSDFGFINYFVGLALQNKDLTVFGKGEQIRSLVYVEDAVEALIMASQHDNEGGELFFACADEHLNILSITQQIVDVVGGKLVNTEWPTDRKVIEIGDAIISNKKIKEVLKWQPTTGFSEGLKRTKDYFIPHLDEYLK